MLMALIATPAAVSAFTAASAASWPGNTATTEFCALVCMGLPFQDRLAGPGQRTLCLARAPRPGAASETT